MLQVAVAIEAPQPIHAARQPYHQERRKGRGRQQEEEADTDGAAERRQHQPDAKPGDRQEQPDRGRERGERRPQTLPQDRQARPLQSAGQQRVAIVGIEFCYAVYRAIGQEYSPIKGFCPCY
jgi:hypothetical protein